MAKTTSRKPDLTETLIILLLSAAVTMFVFWIASVNQGQEKFGNVPEIFKSVWTSVATGAVGVASAIAKSFISNRKDYPNYLAYIGVITILMLIPIAVIIYQGQRSAGSKVATPLGSHSITTNGHNVDFQLNDTIPDPSLRIVLDGSYKVEGRELKGRLTSGTIRTSAVPHPPVHVDKIVFRSCFNNQIGTFVAFYPPQPTNGAIIDVDLTIAPNENLVVPAGNFSFQLPLKPLLDQSWFCATLMGDSGFAHQMH